MEEQIIRQNALSVKPELLLPSIADSRIVMIGDSTHGSREFYQFRAEMSKRLIIEKEFTVIGVEWDFIDVSRINQYILGVSSHQKAWDVLKTIHRFPTFMYKNHPFEEFIEWLKQYNQNTINKVTIYGLDIFGIVSTLKYLLYNLPNQQSLIQKISSVWSNFDSQEYNYGDSGQSVENEINQLQYTGNFFLDEAILQVKEAERYYRIKSENEELAWNLRDQHMARIVTDLVNVSGGKMICWLHNTHSGINFITEFRDKGETTAATLLKQSFGSQVYLIGLLAYTGTVTASNRWYGLTMTFDLIPSIEGSYGDLFHQSVNEDFMLILRNANSQLLQILNKSHYERFIGGSYDPMNELASHYVHAQLYPQFDAIVFYNYSNAIQ